MNEEYQKKKDKELALQEQKIIILDFKGQKIKKNEQNCKEISTRQEFEFEKIKLA